MTTTLDTAPTVPAASAPLISVVYSSTATVPFRDADLAMLLAASRMRNGLRGLTGLLLHRSGRFMQVLEGPEPSVRLLLALLERDRRHTDIRVLDEEPLDERRFASWAMAYRSVGEVGSEDWFGSSEAVQGVPTGSRAAALLERFRHG